MEQNTPSHFHVIIFCNTVGLIHIMNYGMRSTENTTTLDYDDDSTIKQLSKANRDTTLLTRIIGQDLLQMKYSRIHPSERHTLEVWLSKDTEQKQQQQS